MAYCKAISSGHASSDLVACAVVAAGPGAKGYVTPCGRCRQFMSEFGRHVWVICARATGVDAECQEQGDLPATVADTFLLADLLPASFSSEDLQ